MPPSKRPTPQEVLTKLAQEVFVAQPVVAVDAVNLQGAFDPSVPREVLEDILDEGEVDAAGWSIEVERGWRLEMVPGVRVLLTPGTPLEEILDQLDRIRAELVKRPQLLDADWDHPLPSRPRLRVVKDRGD